MSDTRNQILPAPASQLFFDCARDLASSPVSMQNKDELRKVVAILEDLATHELDQEQASSPD